MQAHGKKAAGCMLGAESVGTFILDFPVRKKYILLSHPVYGILLHKLVQTKTSVCNIVSIVIFK